MISNVLSAIDGISIFAIVGLIFFLLIFMVGVLKIFKIDKSIIDELSNLPFESNELNYLDKGIKNE